MALILVNPVARWSGLSLLVSITLAHNMKASSVAPSTCDRKRFGTLAQYGEITMIAKYPATPGPGLMVGSRVTVANCRTAVRKKSILQAAGVRLAGIS